MFDLIDRVQNGLVVMLMLVASIQYTTLSNNFGYISMAILYITFLIIYIESNNVFYAKRNYTFLFLFIAIISVLGSFANLSIDTSIRVFVLLIFTSINLFILPKLIRFKNIIFVIPRVCLIILFIGLLPLFYFPDSFIFLDLSFWSSSSPIVPSLPIITSIYSNPNTLGFIMFVGATMSFTEWLVTKNKQSLILFLVLLIGLIITNNRSGMVSFVIASSLFVVYNSKGRTYVTTLLISGITLTGIFLLALFGLIPGTTPLTEISLNGRRALWISGIETFQNNLIIGQGLEYGGTHNSFIRMFAALGFFGGLSYILMYISVLIQNTRNIESYTGAILTIILTGFLYIQLFEGGSFIGIGIHSTMISLFMGYYITEEINS